MCHPVAKPMQLLKKNGYLFNLNFKKPGFLKSKWVVQSGPSPQHSALFHTFTALNTYPVMPNIININLWFFRILPKRIIKYLAGWRHHCWALMATVFTGFPAGNLWVAKVLFSAALLTVPGNAIRSVLEAKLAQNIGYGERIGIAHYP